MIKEILKDIKSIRRKGSFIQNLAFVSSSKFLIAVGGFLFAPILSRIYEPEAYGAFAVYNAYVVIIATAATLRLPIAFVLPKEEKEFEELLSISILSSLAVGLLSIPVFSFNAFGFSDLHKLGIYQHFIALGVLMSSFVFILNNWAVKEKKFKQSSIRGILLSYSSKSFNVVYGLITKGHWAGLILTNILLGMSSILTIGEILKYEIKQVRLHFSKNKLKLTLKKYKNYPVYVLPTSWAGVLISHAPIIYLAQSFGQKQIGYLSFAIALLDIPIRLLGENAIGQVLLQKTAELKNRVFDENLLILFKKAYYTLAFVSIPGFSILIIFGPELFAWVFSEEWRASGELAQIFSIFYMIRLIATPNSAIMRILEWEKILVFTTIWNGLITVGGVYLAVHFDSFILFVWIYAIGRAFISIIMTFVQYNLLKSRIAKTYE